MHDMHMHMHMMSSSGDAITNCMLSAAAATAAAASFVGPAQRLSSYHPLPVRCSVKALEGSVWSTFALAKDALPEAADVLDSQSGTPATASGARASRLQRTFADVTAS